MVVWKIIIFVPLVSFVKEKIAKGIYTCTVIFSTQMQGLRKNSTHEIDLHLSFLQ
jgi:hypothetical protein